MIEPEDKDAHQSLAILRKENGINVFQRWISNEDIGDILDMFLEQIP